METAVRAKQLPGRVYARVSLAALEHNLERMRACLSADQKICAVIKTDAYGHGAVPLALHMQKLDYIWGFAVAAWQEAKALREAGIAKPVLILGYVFPEDYEELVREMVRPAVLTLEMAGQLNEAAGRAGTVLPVHLAVDTGMGRIGFADTPLSAEQAARIGEMKYLRIEGVFTHFARADEADKSSAREALSRFLSFCDRLKEQGIDVPLRHCSNSAAILELPEAHLDLVRAGITLYGIYPSEEMRRDKRIEPVMELKSHVSFVKEVQTGVPISYGGTYVTKGAARIATIPVGYGDGYPRSLSGRGYVLIHGRQAPICGRICMDQLMVDVTGIPVRVGDEVTLLGRDGGAFLGIDELGALSGRFPYEFVCCISPRVPRVYC